MNDGITKDRAYEIARKVDNKATVVIEYPKGWHFMRKEDEYSMNDAGFAVSKVDGEVMFGVGANMFLQEPEVVPIEKDEIDNKGTVKEKRHQLEGDWDTGAGKSEASWFEPHKGK